jgi:membrane protein DedA with SNARE-associated domain
MFVHVHSLIAFLHSYGYVALGLIVGLESLGLPLPGEGLLIAAALVAGTSHEMTIPGVIAAASLGAILGQMAGFWIGASVGTALLRRYGRYVGLTPRRLALGRLLFRRHGAKLIFAARFIVVLRTIAALLAGANRMPWARFVAANIAGSIAWASVYGVGVAALGREMKHLSGPIAIGVGGVALLILLGSVLAMHWHERRLTRTRRRPSRHSSSRAIHLS